MLGWVGYTTSPSFNQYIFSRNCMSLNEATLLYWCNKLDVNIELLFEMR